MRFFAPDRLPTVHGVKRGRLSSPRVRKQLLNPCLSLTDTATNEPEIFSVSKARWKGASCRETAAKRVRLVISNPADILNGLFTIGNAAEDSISEVVKV